MKTGTDRCPFLLLLVRSDSNAINHLERNEGLREPTLPYEAFTSGATPRFAPGLGPVALGGT